MAEFEVAGRKYRSAKMVARTQTHVLRRMSPILPTLFGSIGLAQKLEPYEKSGQPVPDELRDEATQAGLKLVSAIGELTDEAMDYVLDNCLAVVQINQPEFGGKWANIRGAAGPMFDLDMMEELEIVRHVVQDNYAAVFRGGLARLSGGADT